eukprot:scpid22685/ scgid31865/ 
MSEAKIIDEEQEKRDILAHLIKDGLRVDVGAEEKLQYFYRKLQRTEQQLASTLDNMEELRRQQKEEMQAVETYVSHIRELSEEREQLVNDLETENAQLKAELQRASLATSTALQEQASVIGWKEVKAALSESELREMNISATDEPKQVVHQLAAQRRDLAEKCKTVEAKVLVLQEKQQELQTRLTTSNQLLEAEKKSLEVQLRSVQDQSQNEISQATTSFVEERSNLQAEVKHLTEGNKASSKMITGLEQRSRQLQGTLDERKKQHAEELKQEKLKAAADLATVRTTHDKAVKKLNEEKEQSKSTISNLRVKVQVLEKDKATAQDRASTANTNLSAERAKCQRLQAAQTDDKTKWQEERKRLQSSTQHAQQQLESSKSSMSSLEADLSSAQEELASVMNEKEQIRLRLAAIQTDASSTHSTLSAQVEDVRRARSATEKHLETVQEQAHQLESEASELRSKLIRMEASTKQEKLTHARVVAEMKNQATELQEQLAVSKEMASSSKDELLVRCEENDTRLRTAQEEVGSLEVQLADKEQLCAHLQTEVTTSRQKTIEISETLNLLNNAKKRLEEESAQQLATARREKESLERNLDRIQEEQNKTLSKLDKLKGENAALSAQVNRLTDTIEETRGHMTGKERTMEQLSQQVAEQQSRAEEALSKCDELRRELASQQNDNRGHQETVARLQAQSSHLSQELERQKTKNSDFENTNLHQMEQLRASFEHEKESLQEETERLTTQLRQVTAREETSQKELMTELEQLQAATEESSLLASQNSVLEEKIASLEQQLALAQRQIGSADMEKSKLWAQIKDTQERILPLQAKNEALRNQLDKKSSEHRLTSSYLTKSTKDLDNLQNSFEEQKRALEIEEAKVNTLHQEMARLQGKLEALEQATLNSRQQESDSRRSQEVIEDLRGSLQAIQTDRVLQEQSISEMKRRVTEEKARREREHAENKRLSLELQRSQQLVKVQQQKWQQAKTQKRKSESQSLSALGQVEASQAEKHQLQMHIAKLNDTVDELQSRCSELESSHEHTRTTVKEKYRTVRHAFRTQLSESEDRLSLASAQLEREEEWRRSQEEKLRHLLQEKKELSEQLVKATSASRDMARSVHQTESKVNVLEKENVELRKRIIHLGQQQQSDTERLDQKLASSKTETDRLLQQFTALATSSLRSPPSANRSDSNGTLGSLGSPRSIQDSFAS